MGATPSANDRGYSGEAQEYFQAFAGPDDCLAFQLHGDAAAFLADSGLQRRTCERSGGGIQAPIRGNFEAERPPPELAPFNRDHLSLATRLEPLLESAPPLCGDVGGSKMIRV
jgi:hypothetical protein